MYPFICGHDPHIDHEGRDLYVTTLTKGRDI